MENTLGERLKKIRETCGYKQRDFAPLLGLIRGSYSSKETDSSKLSYESIERLLMDLNVDLNWLVGKKSDNMFLKQAMVNQKNNIGSNTVTIQTDAISIELVQLRTENEVLKKRVQDLEKIISLLERV